MSRKGQGKVKARSRKSQGKVRVRSWQGQGKVKAMQAQPQQQIIIMTPDKTRHDYLVDNYQSLAVNNPTLISEGY